MYHGPTIFSLFQKQKNYISTLSEEVWEDAITQYTKLMISVKDKVVLLKFLHMIYSIIHLTGYIALTQHSPHFATNVSVPFAPSITWCGVTPRFLIWNQIVTRLSKELNLPITLDPLVLLLGIYGDLPIQKLAK